MSWGDMVRNQRARVRQFLADVAPNLEEFLAAALAERRLPSDYYEAVNGDDGGL